jgi:hypothetical protein
MLGLLILLLLTMVVALGATMGLQYLRGIKRKPMMIGIHLLLAIGTMEPLLVLLGGTPNGENLANVHLGEWAAGFVALALFLGLIAAVLARRAVAGAQWILALHAAAGVSGLVAFALAVTGLTGASG